MTLVWVIFMLVLFVMEPLFLKRLFKKYGEKDPVRVMAYAHRLHWVLLGASVVTIVGAMAGSHGWFSSKSGQRAVNRSVTHKWASA